MKRGEGRRVLNQKPKWCDLVNCPSILAKIVVQVVAQSNISFFQCLLINKSLLTVFKS